MSHMGPIIERLWKDESGISSVEYAMLLAMVAGGILLAADMLSKAIMNEMSETVALLDRGEGGDGCGNDGGGDGTGGDGGTGQGGDNTC
ncbi:MAG: Flp family type IVb pilin [Alphaproteobacteria bacterium]